MNKHITEKELIEYQFNLASESKAGEISEHLKTCEQCRLRLEKLVKKFSSLELLREEQEVSEELISKVIAEATVQKEPKLIVLKKPLWLSAVAALFLLGSFLLVFNFIKQTNITSKRYAKEPAQTECRENKYSALNADSDKKITAKDIPSSLRTTGRGEMKEEVLGGMKADKVTEQLIPEKPPFAPASAIELVTLPRRENVQITIYNSADLTLVRERRNLTLKRGWNWLQFMWANTLIDPTSLSLEPLAQKDKIKIEQLVFPARLKEIGRWLIRSEIEVQIPFEITYLTSGLSWRAFYMGTLSEDERRMNLTGYVRVSNNSGEDYENAQTRLLVGKVHLLDEIAELAQRMYPYNTPFPSEKRPSDIAEYYFYPKDRKLDFIAAIGGNLGVLKEAERKEIIKEGLSEYFLYTIEGTETIPDKWGKRLQSFEVNDIEVKSLYKYDEQRWGNQTIRFVAFENDEKHNLGQTPIPDGNIKIYANVDDKNNLTYIGGTDIKYIPVNEEVELNLGPAQLVAIKPTLMDFRTENFVFDNNDNIAGWDEIRKWNLEITNTRDIPAEVEITRGFDTSYWSLDYDKNVNYEKYDATHARFKAEAQPKSRLIFTYTIRTYHGKREELKEKLYKENNI